MNVEIDYKICFIQKQLLYWYKSNKRYYEWRAPNLTPYKYIIAEVLLQRTKADTIKKFYPDFILIYPSWNSLADAEVEDVENFLKPIGLYKQRSKRIISLATEMKKRKGIIPESRVELETIPFMGQYISNAVELIIFKRRLPLLDVNMVRIIERIFEERKLVDFRYDPFIQNLAYQLINHNKCLQINWAILDFAAKICTARKPKCTICPLKEICSYFIKFSGVK